jgi:hypothetical protein
MGAREFAHHFTDLVVVFGEVERVVHRSIKLTDRGDLVQLPRLATCPFSRLPILRRQRHYNAPSQDAAQTIAKSIDLKSLAEKASS